MNDWSHSADYYDVILGKRQFARNATFIASLLKKYRAHNVLELGCGTGLYLAPLKNKGIHIEGLDISKKMLQQARKINVPLYCKDMSSFSLNKTYDAILCLNSSLVLLPTMQLIAKTIVNCRRHLKKGGILIIDLPNHEMEIPASDGTEETTRCTTKSGVSILRSSTFKKKDRWIEEWHGRIGTKRFAERFEELIYDPGTFEKLVMKRFKILARFGSCTGGPFTKKAYRRVYVCSAR